MTPAAARLVAKLAPDNPFGLPRQNAPGKSKVAGKATMLHWLYEQKRAFPDKVLLCRVGEFYETYGMDAVLLVQYA
eukprot:SAG31_NODE_29398_length_396_cov_0.606061_1_plen_75_part_10